jgi:hypothetical protein
MPGPRNLVRLLVGGTLSGALAACGVLAAPENLPAIALEQAVLYRLEVALGIFYGCLLLLTPAYSGLVRGRLPTEISTRGAKFASEADVSADRNETTIKELQQTTDCLREDLTMAAFEINRLEKQIQVTTHDQH